MTREKDLMEEVCERAKKDPLHKIAHVVEKEWPVEQPEPGYTSQELFRAIQQLATDMNTMIARFDDIKRWWATAKSKIQRGESVEPEMKAIRKHMDDMGFGDKFEYNYIEGNAPRQQDLRDAYEYAIHGVI